MSVAILFRDAFLTLFLWLPMHCRLTVCVLALTTLVVSLLGGVAANCCKRRGLVAVLFGSAVLLPLLIFWVCLGLSPFGIGLVTVVALTGLLFCVVCWWMRLLFCKLRG